MLSRREFLQRASLLSGGLGAFATVPASILKALAIEPAEGSTFMDADHVVILMQENHSFDHAFGSLRGVRGFEDPRAIELPDGNPVWLQTDVAGNVHAPFGLKIHETNATWMSDLPHDRHSQIEAANEGKHDQWLKVKRSGIDEYADMPLTLGYYDRGDIPFIMPSRMRLPSATNISVRRKPAPLPTACSTGPAPAAILAIPRPP